MKYIVQDGDTLYGISKQFGVSVESIMEANSLTNTNIKAGLSLTIPLSKDSIYIVEKGDTLYSISKKYNISISELMELNHLSSNLLSVGQVLVLSPVEEEQTGQLYIVKKGDTLYSIAKKYGISVSDLISLNGLESSALSIGQVLVVAGYDDSMEMGSSCYGDGYIEPTYVTYTVKKGDNLYTIAKRYGVSVDSILKLNNLSSSSLSIGQILKIKEES